MQTFIEAIFSLIIDFVGLPDFYNSLMVAPFIFMLLLAVLALFHRLLRSF